MNLSDKDIVRFWSKVDIRGENECWTWKDGKFSDGYGAFSIGKYKTYKAHRVAWQIANGREPLDEMDIAHAPVICHNRACCNPNHLSEKTPSQNSLDMEIDGTMPHLSGEKHPRVKLTQAQVNQVPILRAQGLTQRAIGKLLGVGQQQICKIENKQRWK